MKKNKIESVEEKFLEYFESGLDSYGLMDMFRIQIKTKQ